jgi:GntR family transcriptional regulator
VYLQIVEGIRASIAAGVYRPGEILPSLRALAVDLVVNPNTVQKAYDELERQGLLTSRRGVGIFVTQRGTESAQSRAEDAVVAAFRQGVQAGQAANMTSEQIRAAFDQALAHALKVERKRR